MCKRVKLNSYEPIVRDKNMKFVTHSWYNKTLSFGTPFEFLKTYKFFQCGAKSPVRRLKRSRTDVEADTSEGKSAAEIATDEYRRKLEHTFGSSESIDEVMEVVRDWTNGAY